MCMYNIYIYTPQIGSVPNTQKREEKEKNKDMQKHTITTRIFQYELPSRSQPSGNKI